MNDDSPRKSYKEKLKDPRWQRKRLEVFQRDNFTCRYCGEWEETLHVHHLRYQSGAEPWESPFEDLLTVCEPCHEHETTGRRQIEQGLLDILRDTGFSADDLLNIVHTLAHSQFCCEKREFVEFFDWLMDEDNHEDFVRQYFQNGLPSEFLRANPGYEGRPIPNE